MSLPLLRPLCSLAFALAFAAGPALAQSGGSAKSATPAASSGVLDFGDDSSDWANDGECDDPRFIGAGMADPPLSKDHVSKDASDCEAAFVAGTIALRPPKITTPLVYQGIDFGTDSGDWANDDECDDPRFSGGGMTDTPLLDADIRADASDCLAGFKAGKLQVK